MSRLVSVLQYFVAWKHSVQDRCVLQEEILSDESEEFPRASAVLLQVSPDRSRYRDCAGSGPDTDR